MEKPTVTLLSDVQNYYSQKLSTYGDTPSGVDWNGYEGQILRFEQLSKILPSACGTSEFFSVNDLGCGYGAYLDYLKRNYPVFSYTGYDISNEMITTAKKKYNESDWVKFVCSAEPNIVSDYSMASGIFNVRLSWSDDDWFDYLINTLDILNRTSRFGFSFNALTSYADEDRKRDYLYYTDPCKIFDVCNRRYSKQIALLHDYGLYEFTVLVKK